MKIIKIEEIKDKNYEDKIYEISNLMTIPFFIRVRKYSGNEAEIEITQPILRGEAFSPEKYFKQGYPSSLLINKEDFQTLFNTINKILIVESIDEEDEKN